MNENVRQAGTGASMDEGAHRAEAGIVAGTDVRHVFLLRHAEPDLGGAHRCIGQRSDPELTDKGREQASALADCFPDLDLIYSSPLARARQTAEIILKDGVAAGAGDVVAGAGSGAEASGGSRVVIIPELTEMDLGKWDGLTFSEIRSSYPELYEARGRDWSLLPEDGESLEHAADRMQGALLRLLAESPGDVVAVTSDGAIRALLHRYLHLDTREDPMPRQPYGSITVLRFEPSDGFTVTAQGRLPGDFPSDGEITDLWATCGTPPQVQQHCKVVCDASLAIADSLEEHGIVLKRGILRAAALLHDLFKAEGFYHYALAADLLRERGYLQVARAVYLHQDGEELPGRDSTSGRQVIDEAQVLYLSDKMIRGTQVGTVDERFSESRAKCHGEEALRMHALRYRRAKQAESYVEAVTGRSPLDIIAGGETAEPRG